MKMVKSLLLGAAAGMIACTAAYAKDLPASPTATYHPEQSAPAYGYIPLGTPVIEHAFAVGLEHPPPPLVVASIETIIEGNGGINRYIPII